MSIEVGLYTLLKDDTGVTEQVSGRIFGGLLPRDEPTYPCVVWTVASTDSTDLYTIQGATGLRKKRIQFDTYGKTYTSTLNASDEVRQALENFIGHLDDNTEDGIEVQSCMVVTDQDFPPEPGA